MFPLVQAIYWFGIAAWFGTAVAVLISINSIFRTIKEHDPTLPKVLSVNIDGDHATLLAIDLLVSLLKLLNLVAIFGGTLVMVGGVGQLFLAETGGPRRVELILRGMLLLCSVLLVIYGWRFTTPKLARGLKTYIDQADDPEARSKNRDQIIRCYRDAVVATGALACTLGGLILFSANIVPTLIP